MATFSYEVLNLKGDTLKGLIEADSLRLARQRLRDQGLFPLVVEPYTPLALKRFLGQRLAWKPRLRLAIPVLALITRQLATLLVAGIPLEEVLQTVGEQADNPKVKSILFAVRGRVLEGHTLAESLGHFPSVFPPLYRATIAAGEQTGRLDRVLVELATYTERQQALRQKIQQAMIYPLLMTSVSILIVIFLMIFVVPKMVAVFISNSQVLPLSTRILIFMSHSFRYFVPLVLVLVVGGGIGLHQVLKRYPPVRTRLHQFYLRLPLVGKTLKILNTTRFARTLGILLVAGVPVLDALKMAGDLINIVPIKRAMAEAGTKVREGVSIHKALKTGHYFSPMSLHLIASGESSGQLAPMLERAADYQENALNRQIDTLLTLFEPLLILVMGSVVLFIVLAVLLPVFSLNQNLS